MKTYKIWAYIEEIDEEQGMYEDISEPLSCGEFRTKEEAFKFREDLFDNRPQVE